MKKTNIRNRIVSILLVLVMLLTMVPITGVTASAAEPEWTTVNTFDELKEAMQRGTKTNIKLGKNINTNDEENHKHGLTSYDDILVGNTITLDLNGKKLTLNSGQNNVGSYINVTLGNLTVQDSVGGGEIFLNDEYKGGSTLILLLENGAFTLKSGTIRATTSGNEKSGITLIQSYGTVNIEGGTLTCTQKDGTDGRVHGDPNHWSSCYALKCFARDNVQTTITGGEFTGFVRISVKNNGKQNKITNVIFNSAVVLDLADKKNMTWAKPGLTIENVKVNGTLIINGVCYHEKSTDIAIVIGDGWYATLDVNDTNVWVYDYDLFKQTYEAGGNDVSKATFKQGYAPYQLKGGTYRFMNFGSKAEHDIGYRYTQEAFRHILGNGAIKVGNYDDDGYKIYTYSNIGESFRYGDYMAVMNSSRKRIPFIPNAWGMKSVTLDGKKIDYFKDWKGTVERMDNSTAHTLKFEWYPLASELVNAGYTYRAKCEHYISGSTAVQQTDTIAADKTSHTVTIPAGADPKVYSYDLQLNLDKNGSSVGIFSNVHIVKLVVSEAPVVDTRTSIESVTLKVPKLKEGAASGDNFTLSGTNTGVSTINTVWEGIPASGAVAGNFYAARITLTAKDGYAFNTNTQVKLNGDYLSTGSGINNGGAGMTIYVNVLVRHEHNFGTWQIAGTGNVHFRKCSCGVQEEKPHEWKYLEGQDKYKCTVCGYEIDGEKERITYVYASPRSPIAGEHPGDYTPAEWVKIGGANYKVESIVWKNMDDTDVTTFEAGKIYKGTVTFKADTGFVFADTINGNHIFNSSTVDIVGDYTLGDGATTLTVTFKLENENVVRPGLKAKVKLPTLSDKVGQSLPAAKLVDTTLPENVALVYSVYEDNLLSEEITDPDYKVKPNQKYIYAVWLKHGDSTDITEITKTYNVSYEVTDGGDTETYTDLVGYGVLAMYQTPDTSKINSVALTVTAPKYGKAPATTATRANDTRYTVGTPTWSPAVTDGKFGANTYTVSIPVTAASGYSFDENGIYTINGYVATYADGKVSYTFPQLIAPHTHDTDVQPWVYMDPGTHIKTCTAGDDFKVEAHDFSAWTKVDESTHSRTCSKCKKSGEATNYTETAEHTWVWVVDKEAALNQLGLQHEECTGCHAKRSENTEIPALRDYAVTVTCGTATVAAGTSITRAMEGVEVTVTADAPKTGRVFDKWVVKAGGVTLANETSATTTFTMPGNDVKIEATYKDAPPSHSVYVGMTYTAGNFIYQITSIDTATLGKSKVIGVVAAKKNKITKVTIPDRADCKGYRLNVTAVGDKAFKSMKKLKKVTFGSNVKVIGKNAFSNCKKLDKISFKNVTTIGNDAFAGCKALKKLTIGNKVTVIGKNAFKKCSKLKTVVIGKAVKTISSKAFIGDNKIKKITFKGKKLKTVKKNAFSKKAKKNIKSKKTKLKGNKKAIKLFKKKLKIK